jgi:hypothetical protein
LVGIDIFIMSESKKKKLCPIEMDGDLELWGEIQWSILEQESDGKSKEWIRKFYQKHRVTQVAKGAKPKCPLCSYEISSMMDPTEHLKKCLDLCNSVDAFPRTKVQICEVPKSQSVEILTPPVSAFNSTEMVPYDPIDYEDMFNQNYDENDLTKW